MEVNIVKCENGHYYDASLSSFCPICARDNNAKNGGDNAKMMPGGSSWQNYENQQPDNSPDYHNYPNYPNYQVSIGDDPVANDETQPFVGISPVNENAMDKGGFEEIGPTMPSWGNPGKQIDASNSKEAFGLNWNRKAGPQTFNNTGFENSSPTEMVNYSNINSNFNSNSNSISNSSFNSSFNSKNKDAVSPQDTFNKGVSSLAPVVGWLICVNGEERGRDYRIHEGYNWIGRGSNMDICIRGDGRITREREAVVAYDPLTKIFAFAKENGVNIVRHNGKMLMSEVELKEFDRIILGETELMFVPLCGERFDWNNPNLNAEMKLAEEANPEEETG